MKPFFCTLIVVVFLTSCDVWDSRLHVKNNSDYPISFEVMEDTIIHEGIRGLRQLHLHISELKILPGDVSGHRTVLGSYTGYIKP